jgi:L,D-peptidoglycan transpeptidase YkuD (ErfK/YbiS/YcfS/YnhG family)
MIKSILILISIQIFLFADNQIVLVVAKDFNTSKASLACYEDGKQVSNTIDVNIGTNGLGWGISDIIIPHKNGEPFKKEGDRKAPAGVFKLTKIFGYEKNKNFHMPYIYASTNLICVDDVDSMYYNQLINMQQNPPKSFEFMRRDDNQYQLGIVVEHNKKAIKGRGSCIFMHVRKSENASTAGCTSMSLENLKKIASWLDKSKNPTLIQIPKAYAKEVIKLYPELKNSKLLN